MNSARVKICGVTSLKDLQMVGEAGADAVGIITEVPSSPRSVSVNDAKTMLRKVPLFLTTVVVVVVKELDFLVRIYNKLKPDILQIHAFGKHAQEIREQLPNTRIIGAIPANADTLSIVRENVQYFDAILLDSSTPEKHGGTGITHDWSLSQRVREEIDPTPLILAGGLTPQNIQEAIKTVKPYAVDVASGTESHPGRKDPIKVYEFVKKAKGFES